MVGFDFEFDSIQVGIYENAEETYVPVGILSVHFLLVVATSAHIVGSVKHDNSRLPERERMVLGRIFFTAMTVEFIVSSLWLAFNVADAMQCHTYYSYGFEGVDRDVFK